MAAPQKVNRSTTIWSGNPTFVYVSQRTEGRILKSYPYTHVRNSIIRSRQKTETTHVSIDGSTGKTKHTYGVLFNLKKEGDSDTCYNIEETWGHYTKLLSRTQKKQILYDASYRSYLE